MLDISNFKSRELNNPTNNPVLFIYYLELHSEKDRLIYKVNFKSIQNA